MLLGVHVSTEGGIYQALSRAHELKCNTVQFFSRNPRQWRSSSINKSDLEEFKRKKKLFKISPIFVHVPYLINLASPEEDLRQNSIKAYIEDIKEAYDLGADYIVTHMGSHKKTSEAAGLIHLTDALNKIIAQTKDAPVGILLENTSGSGSWLGYKFCHQKEVYNGIINKARIGFCLDTAHAYTAGYDIATKAGLAAMLKEFDSLLGIDLIKLIHLNDTKDKCDSRLDRHAHIGKGRIGKVGMKRILKEARLKNCAFILETPKDTQDADKKNLTLVRKLAGVKLSRRKNNGL